MRKRILASFLAAVLLVTSIPVPPVMAAGGSETEMTTETNQTELTEETTESESIKSESTESESSVETEVSQTETQETTEERQTEEQQTEEQQTEAVMPVEETDMSGETGGIEDTAVPLKLLEAQDVELITGEEFWFSFTPEEAGKYAFYSEGDCDPYAQLWEDPEQLNMIESNDDSGYEEMNFSVGAELEAGHTYYLRVSFYSVGTECRVLVKKQPVLQNAELIFSNTVYAEEVCDFSIYGVRLKLTYDDGKTSTVSVTGSGLYGERAVISIDGTVVEESTPLSVGQHEISVTIEDMVLTKQITVLSWEEFFAEKIELGQSVTDTVAAGTNRGYYFQAENAGAYTFSIEGAAIVVYRGDRTYHGRTNPDSLEQAKVGISLAAGEVCYIMLESWESQNLDYTFTVGNGQIPDSIVLEGGKDTFVCKSGTDYYADLMVTLHYADGTTKTFPLGEVWNDDYGNRINDKYFRIVDGQRQPYEGWIGEAPAGEYEMGISCGDAIAYHPFTLISRLNSDQELTQWTLGTNEVVKTEQWAEVIGKFTTGENTVVYSVSGDSSFILEIYDEYENKIYPGDVYLSQQAEHTVVLEKGKSYLFELGFNMVDILQMDIAEMQEITALEIQGLADTVTQGEFYPNRVSVSATYADGSQQELNYSHEGYFYDEQGQRVQYQINNAETGERVEDIWNLAKGSYHYTLTGPTITKTQAFTVCSKEELATEITLGQPHTLEFGMEEYSYVKFIPEKTSGYQVTFDAESTFVVEESGEQIYIDWNSPSSVMLEAGKTYLFGFSCDDGSPSVTVELQETMGIQKVEVLATESPYVDKIDTDLTSGTQLRITYGDGSTVDFLGTVGRDQYNYRLAAERQDMDGNPVYDWQEPQPGSYQIDYSVGGVHCVVPVEFLALDESVGESIAPGDTKTMQEGRQRKIFVFEAAEVGMYELETDTWLNFSVYDSQGTWIDKVGDSKFVVEETGTHYLRVGGYSPDGLENEVQFTLNRSVGVTGIEMIEKQTEFVEGMIRNLRQGMELRVSYEDGTEQILNEENSWQDSYGNFPEFQYLDEYEEWSWAWEDIPAGTYQMKMLFAGQSSEEYTVTVRTFDEVNEGELQIGANTIQNVGSEEHYYTLNVDAANYTFTLGTRAEMYVIKEDGEDRQVLNIDDSGVFFPGLSGVYRVAIRILEDEDGSIAAPVTLNISQSSEISSIELHPVKTEFSKWRILENDFTSLALADLSATVTYSDGTTEEVGYGQNDSTGNYFSAEITTMEGDNIYDIYPVPEGTYMVNAWIGTANASYIIEVVDDWDTLPILENGETLLSISEDDVYVLKYETGMSQSIQLETTLNNQEIAIWDRTTGETVTVTMDWKMGFLAEEGHSYVIWIRGTEWEGDTEITVDSWIEPAPVSMTCLNASDFAYIPADWPFAPGKAIVEITYADGTVEEFPVDTNYDWDGAHNNMLFYDLLKGEENAPSLEYLEEGDYTLKIQCQIGQEYKVPRWASDKLDAVQKLETVIDVKAVSKDDSRWDTPLETEIPMTRGTHFYRFTIPKGGVYSLACTGESYLKVMYDSVIQEVSGGMNIAMGRGTILYVMADAIEDNQISLKLTEKTALTMKPLDDVTYNGQAFTPEVVVMDGNYQLQPEEYTVTYRDNTNAGTAYVTVTGVGEYEGYSAQSGFHILARRLEDMEITPPEDVIYTGWMEAPQFTITDPLLETELVEGLDYYYDDNGMGTVGTVTVAVTGIGNYEGELTLTYEILPKDIADLEMTFEQEYEYTGNAIVPDIILKYNDRYLRADEYIIDWGEQSAVEIGEKTIRILGTDNYTGERSLTLNIVPKNFSNLTVRADQFTFTYNGQQQRPDISVWNGSIELTEGTDYDIVWPDCVHAGTSSIVLIGKGNYVGSISRLYSIVAAQMAGVEAQEIPAQEYTGYSICPPAVLTFNGQQLTEGTDYTVSYRDNLEVGQATMTVTGKGDFTGNKTITFEIKESQVIPGEFTAVELTENEAVSAEFDETAKSRWFSYTAAEAGLYSFGCFGGAEVAPKIYTEADGVLTERESVEEEAAMGMFQRHLMLEAGETCYFRTYGKNKTYSVILRKAQNLEFGTTGEEELAVSIPEQTAVYVHFIQTEEEKDYSFTISEGSKMALYAADGSQVPLVAHIGTQRALLAEGDYYLRITGSDSSAKEALLSASRTDAGQPGVIETLMANGEADGISLSWNMAADIDTVAYRIYRRAEGEETETRVAEVKGRASQTWKDTEAVAEQIYYYSMTEVDLYGREGAKSESVPAQLGKDLEAPTVTKMSPENATAVNGNREFKAYARDNVEVTAMKVAVSADAGETWTDLTVSEITESYGSYVVSAFYDTTQNADGMLKVKATALDATGNESNPLIYTYRVDNTGPAQVMNVTAASTSVNITLHWEDVADEDLKYYKVEQKIAGEFVSVQNTYQKLGAVIEGLQPDTEYIFRVVGYDTVGNRGIVSDEITVITAGDTTAPVVSGIRPRSGYYNTQIPVSFSVWDDTGVKSLTMQVTNAEGVWEDVQTWNYDELSGGTYTQDYILDVSERKEGKLRVRAIAADAAGNVSDSSNAAPFVEHVVDRTPASAPAGVIAEGQNGYIEVRWTQGAETDLNGYNVYRRVQGTEEFHRLAGALQQINYLDRTAEAGVIYEYQITNADKAGNESAPSTMVTASVLEDKEAPEIVSLYPADGASVGAGSRSISAWAQDNRQVDKVLAEYRLGETGTWTELGIKENLTSYSEKAGFKIPEDILEDGMQIFVRVKAVDKAGLESAWTEAGYSVDLEAPQIETLTIEFDAKDNQTALAWKGLGEEDARVYRVFRREAGMTSWQFLGQRAAAKTAQEYSFFDSTLKQTAVTYEYRIEAMDTYGNSRDFLTEAIELPDRSAPVPKLNCESVMETGVEYLIDASRSTDNKEITEFELDLGDGTVTKKSSIVHTYASAGTYTITLKVWDVDGNVSTLEKTITVRERKLLGTLKVRVTNADGAYLPDADVYFDLGTDQQFVRRTDSAGLVTITAEAGTHSVGCIKGNNEYLPAKKEVLISAGNVTEVRFVLVEQPIVEGKFEIHRMTFEEIVDAGIDISKPENQYIVKVNVRLDYGKDEYHFSFNYNPSTGSNDAEPIEVDSGGKPHKLYPTVIGGGGGGGGGISWGGGSDEEEEITVAIMDVPITTYVLKEFFDVKLHIINNAATEFSMLNNRIHLNVPKGLSIAETTNGSAQTADVEIPEIKGQTTETIQWIIRGDEVGEYYLSADYSGTLSQFNRNVTAQFKADEPVKVFGLSGLEMTVHVADQLKKGMLYYDVDLENKGEIDVYKPYIETQDILLETYLFQPGIEEGTYLDEMPQSLKIGEKIVQHYESDTRGTLTLEDKNAELQAYWAEMANTYGMKVNVVKEPLSYFRAADDIFTLRFDSQGGSPVDPITGIKLDETITLPEDPVKDGVYFEGWYSKIGGKGSRLTQTTKITRSMTWYAYWTTERANTTTTVKKIDGNEYGIHVTDITGAPIEGATVTMESKDVETQITDKDGDAVFTKMTVDDIKLTVSKSGYKTHTEKNYEKASEMVDMVTLYTKAESTYKVSAVYYNGPTNSNLNLVKHYKRMSEESAVTFSITVEKLEDQPDVTRYELWQNSTPIGVFDADGKLEGLKGSMFAAGSGIHVRVYYMDGEEEKFVRTKLNMEIIAAPVKKNTLSIGESIAVTLDDEVPIFGGSTFEIGLPPLPIEMFIEESEGDITAHLGINVANMTMKDAEKREEMKEFLFNRDLSNSMGKMSVSQVNRIIKAHQKSGLTMPFAGFKKKAPELNILGYVEATVGMDGSFKSATGYICVQVEASARFGWSTVVVFIPVAVDITGKLTVNFNGAITYDYEMNQISSNVCLDLAFGLEVFGGVGVSGLLAGGGYGSGTVSAQLQIGNSQGFNPGVNYVQLDAEVGLKAYAGGQEYSRAWKKATWDIYNRKEKRSAYAMNQLSAADSNMYAIEEYVTINRSYLENQSEWTGEISEVKDASDNKVNKIQTGIPGMANPKTVTAGDTTLMAFIQDDGTRDDANIGQLVYSVYENGQWSKPVPVDDNDRVDVSFELSTDGTDIWLTYQEANVVFDTIDEDMKNYAQELGIVTAKYIKELGAFERTENLTDANAKVYHSMPRTYTADGKQYSLWVANPANEYFNMNSTNTLMMSVKDGDSRGEAVVLAENLNCITELAVGQLNGSATAVYTVDQDNDLNTTGDRSLYLLPLAGGEPQQVAAGEIADLQFSVLPCGTEKVLNWYDAGAIYTLTSAESEPVNFFGETGQIVSRNYKCVGNRIFYTKAEENASNIYYIERKADGSFSVPVALTKQGAYLENLQIVELDGRTYAIVVENVVSYGETDIENKCSLAWISLDEVHDLVLAGTDFSDDNVVPNGILPVILTIENKGSSGVSRVKYEVKDSTDAVVAEGIQEMTIESGMSGETTIEISLGADLKDGVYSIEIWEADAEKIYEETDNVDNVAQISVASAELVLTAGFQKVGLENQVAVLVENKGQIATAGQVWVYNEENPELYKEIIDVSELAPGESESFQIRIGKDFFKNPGAQEAITVKVVSDIPDYALQNNSRSFVIQNAWNVNYYLDGTLLQADTYESGEVLVLPQPPVTEGFLGWFALNPEGEEIQLTEGMEVTFGLEAHARYEEAVYEVLMSDGTTETCVTLEELQALLPEASQVTVKKDTQVDAPLGIAEEVTLIIPEGVTWTVADGVRVTNQGTLQNQGTVVVNGTLENQNILVSDGTLQVNGTLDNQMTVTNNGILENKGNVKNEGHLYNNGDLKTSEGILDGSGLLLEGEGSTVEGDVSCETSDHVHIFAEEYTTDRQPTYQTEGEKSRHCTVDGCQAKTDVQVIPKLPLETFTGITVTGYNGAFDNKAHSITVSGVPAGAVVKYSTSANGVYTTTKPTYKAVGTYRIYYRVEKTNYRTLSGSAAVVITACQHNFGAYTVTKEATVLETGSKVRTCRICGTKQTEIIPKLTPVIRLNVKKLPMRVKQSANVIKVLEMGKGDYIASWKSSNPKIVSVKQSGKLTARKVGKAKITVTLKSGISKSVTINVQKKQVATTSLIVTPRIVKLKAGKSLKLAAGVKPLTSQQKVTYTSAKPKVASVSRTGVVKALKRGKTKITVRSGRKTITVSVTVTKK